MAKGRKSFYFFSSQKKTQRKKARPVKIIHVCQSNQKNFFSFFFIQYFFGISNYLIYSSKMKLYVFFLIDLSYAQPYYQVSQSVSLEDIRSPSLVVVVFFVFVFTGWIFEFFFRRPDKQKVT